jgi:hypothetical protein
MHGLQNQASSSCPKVINKFEALFRYLLVKLKIKIDTGFRIGTGTGKMYLVIQMHYKNKFHGDIVDNSGITIELTTEKSVNIIFYLRFGY